MPLTLALSAERWPIAGTFAISRGAKTEAEGVLAAIEALRPQLAAGLDRQALQRVLPPGAARNALDCAFWDLEAKRSGRPVHALADLPEPRACVTAFTISLAAPEVMAKAAAGAAE